MTLHDDNADLILRTFRPDDRDAFRDLNLDWISKYFWVEEADRQMLSNPGSKIIKPGGQIFMAEFRNRTVGTCALLRLGEDTYELGKMAVAEESRGLGVGRKLLTFAIEWAREQGARKIFLVSNTSLTPAITLYESHGFQTIPYDDTDPEYARSNIAMELDL